MQQSDAKGDGAAPSVSIIVPVFNGARYLRRCLECLFAQSVPAKEIFIVDDGSTDGSPELVAPPARLLSTGGRRGAGYARNLGAKTATGDYLFFTDVDVEAPPDWLAKGLAALRDHDVLCGGGGYVGPVGDSFSQHFAHLELVWRRRRHHGYVQTLVSNNMYCERKLFLAAGGFPENYRAASSEDMEFSWKVAQTQRLWWDKENGVRHNFPDTLEAYLRQQFRFARDAVPMLLLDRALLRGPSHHGKQLYLEILLTGGILAGALWLPAGLALSGVCLLAVGLVNIPFLAFLCKQRGVWFCLGGLLMVLARDFAVAAGVCAGLWQMASAVVRGGVHARRAG